MKKLWILSAIVLIMMITQSFKAQDDYRQIEKNIPFEDLDELQVEINVGLVDLTLGKAKGKHLLEADINYNAECSEPQIEFERSGKIGYLSINSNDIIRDYDEDTHLHRHDEYVLLFSPRVKINFDLHLGLADGQLNMGELKVAGMKIEAGLSETNLNFDKPNDEEIENMGIEVGLGKFNALNLGNANFKNINLECGLGNVNLNLEGDWKVKESHMNIEVGLGRAEIEIPAKLGVEVICEDNLTSSVSMDEGLKKIREGVYRTSNWESATELITIDAEVGMGRVEIKLLD